MISDVFFDERTQTVWNDLEFRSEAANGLQLLHMVKDGPRLDRGLAHGPPSCPSDVGRDQADMGDHGHVVVTKRLLDIQRRRTIKAVPAHRRELERRAQVIFGGGKLAIGAEGKPHLHKAAPCRFAHFGGEEPPFDRQHVDARRICCRSLFRRGYVEHGNLLPPRLRRADVVDGRSICFVNHGYTVNALRKASRAASSSPVAKASMATGPVYPMPFSASATPR